MAESSSSLGTRIRLRLASSAYVGVLVATANVPRRVRMSHNNGLTARGTVRVVDRPTFPAHEFFRPGRTFSCRLRHASVSYDDDTVLQVRSASLKLADARYRSPLDLEMNTGTTSLFWTARNFFEFAAARGRVDELAFSTYYDKYPQGLLAAKEGIRRVPETFAQMYYHSQCAQAFVGLDGRRRYVKFRLIPGDRGPEVGLVPMEDLVHRWKESPAPGERRSPNYLKQEYGRRLSAGPVRYHLQLQLHDPVPGESDEILNCNVAWDEGAHPWQDVAEVVVHELLSREESNLMRFSVGHAPPSLGILPARSLDDYRSVNYLRARTGPSKAARLLAYRLFGMPDPLPDERP